MLIFIQKGIDLKVFVKISLQILLLTKIIFISVVCYNVEICNIILVGNFLIDVRIALGRNLVGL